MSERIGVIAGTPMDTQMGVDFLEGKGINAIGYSVSNNPKEQSRLQLLSKDKLYNIVIQIVFKAKSQGINKIFVYCNSLSAAIDMNKVSKETDTLVITPFIAYRDIAKDFSKLLIFAANGQSCAKIEEILEESNEDIRIWSISALPLVEEIETHSSPMEIYDKLAMDHILNWAKINKIEGILLGCTHFPYLADILLNKTRIPIIDPAEKMLEKLILGDLKNPLY
ncbi:MAG: Asp/Glu racemase [Tissierella sp.]|nr:Asp/Glu racemase [Tissierella sp.]